MTISPRNFRHIKIKQERITFHRGAIINGLVTCYAPFWKILELRMTLHHFALFWVPLIDFVLFHCDRKILTFALTYEVPKVKKKYFVTIKFQQIVIQSSRTHPVCSSWPNLNILAHIRFYPFGTAFASVSVHQHTYIPIASSDI